MYTYKGKRALITGASTGIGASFARALAKRGMNLVLVARSEDKMKVLASELTAAHGVAVDVIASDLSQPNAAQTVYEATRQRGLAIDMLVNNAGFSTYGNFETIPADKEQEEIAVNIATLVALTHAFVPAMLEKGESAILNVASNVGFFALPARPFTPPLKPLSFHLAKLSTPSTGDEGCEYLPCVPARWQPNFLT